MLFKSYSVLLLHRTREVNFSINSIVLVLINSGPRIVYSIEILLTDKNCFKSDNIEWKIILGEAGFKIY